MTRAAAVFAALLAFGSVAAWAAEPEEAENAPQVDSRRNDSQPAETPKAGGGAWSADTFSGLALRGIGPALFGGRIADFAVDPTRHSTYYVAVAAAGIWKTVNSGTTWEPIFEHEGSYSIGCITMDPKDPLVLWVGSGENNNQRSVGYGDGVYKSTDGGKSWKNMGLKDSQHIARILVDPRDSNTVYVAAQGPLWNGGGDRGVYKTTDGGRTWKQALRISDDTGVSDLVMDPRNPDVLYAAAQQRRRHIWTLIDGGPESGIYKTRDGGATWDKLTTGLPKEDLGRIGLAIAPTKPDVVYAVIESTRGKGGFFRSTTAGGSWEKMSGYSSGSAQYYHELIPDPKDADRVYAMDTFMQVTEDGGKTFQHVPEVSKHVDNHALWIDPDDTDHLLGGCDGGVYESWDRGKTWDFKSNLPILQLYRVAVDYAKPFYNVYGGTQDNYSFGGPSQTNSVNGIANADWFVTNSGDGFFSQVDPTDPNTIYAEAQNGGLVRFDKKSGEIVDIQPQPGKADPPLRWNWDSPLLISPHSHTRLYFGAQRLFKSDDRGNTWQAVSPDLTRQLDRNKLPVMGRIWSVDAVSKNGSTAFYGNATSISESPLKEGVLYVGTDDGLIQASGDGGAHWQKIDRFPGVPEMTYIAHVEASAHAADTVYAALNNMQMGDFKPYLLKSTDRGAHWTSIAGDLPSRGGTWTIVEDPGDPNLLFAGTEFGAFFSRDGGKRWVQLKGNLPTIPVRDIAIQKRENDLVLGTFGRGIYILDDYTPLRASTPDKVKEDAFLLPVKPVSLYNPWSPIGGRGKGFQGDSYFVAPNPPFGAIFTYYLKDDIKSRKERRKDREAEIIKAAAGAKEPKGPYYPSWEELRAEDREKDPQILLTVTDEAGTVVRRLTGPAKAGFQRVAWDLRFPPANPTELNPAEPGPFDEPPRGPTVVPGTYKVALAELVDGKIVPLGQPQTFTAQPLGLASLPARDAAEALAFQQKVARLQRAVQGAVGIAAEAQNRLSLIQKALLDTPAADPGMEAEALALEGRLKDLQVQLSGDSTIASRNEPTPPSISNRVQSIITGAWVASAGPTTTHRESYRIASEQFVPVLANLTRLLADLKGLEDRMEKDLAPWTPGRVPQYTPE